MVDEELDEPHPATLDPNWKPDTYRYRNERLEIIWTTSALLSDESAIHFFAALKDFGPGFKPVYLEVRRAGEDYKSWTMLPVKYHWETNEVEDLEASSDNSDTGD